MLSSCAAYCQSCHWRLVLLGVKKLKQDVKFIAKNKEKGRTRTVAYYYIYLTRKTTKTTYNICPFSSPPLPLLPANFCCIADFRLWQASKNRYSSISLWM